MESEPSDNFKKISHLDIGLVSVDTYAKRYGAYQFAMKYNNKIYYFTF